jgi:hypothetical protein
MLRPWVVVRERYSGMTKSPEQNDYWGILPCWRLLLNLVVSFLFVLIVMPVKLVRSISLAEMIRRASITGITLL